MRYLLDSHVIYQAAFEQEKLSKHHKEIISSPDNLLYVSYVSLWELVIKRSTGKIEFSDDFYIKIHQTNYQLVSITTSDLFAYGRLPSHHRDPFDRMLIAQAQAQGFVFLTDDKEILKYGNLIHLL